MKQTWDRCLDVLHSADAMVKFHGWSTVAWILMIPVCVFTPLKDSVPFLVFISVWALVASHWAGFQAAQAEKENGGGEQ